MVQIFDPTPRPSSASMIGEALGTGFGKRMAISEAENAMQQAQGDPVKLASAMGRLLSASPDMARAAGPMYQAMLSQMQGQAMGGLDEGKPADFPYPTTGQITDGAETQGITKPEDIQKQIESFIPPSQEQIINEAGQLYRQNPQMFAGDPNKAIDFVTQKYAQKEKQVQAYQQRHQNLTDIQDNVVTRLRKQSSDLGAKIPARAMSEFEKEAIDYVKEGHTEEQAMRKYGDKIDEASRQYQQIKDIGNHGLITNNEQSISSLKALQKDFKKRNDLRNFADTISADLKVSYPVAYSFADPVSDHPPLNKYINDLPTLQFPSSDESRERSQSIVPKLAKLIADENASPQAVFYKMMQKGYDPLLLKDYLDRKRDDLGLQAYQTDQLGKEIQPRVKFANDIWISIMGGLE